MKIEEVLDLDRTKEVIEELKKERKGDNFSSHDFIHKYSKKHEHEYVSKLSICKSKARILHSLMARYLARHSKELNIEKEKGKRSGKGDPTIFGNETKVQGWKFKN